ncbi:hypothetical protein BGW80DRAFT_1322518, partial [Lactifluus volemus]
MSSTGSVLMFAFTILISWPFQLPGVFPTYLLHGSHAGQFGSLTGLAFTLIQWGFGTTVMGAFSPWKNHHRVSDSPSTYAILPGLELVDPNAAFYDAYRGLVPLSFDQATAGEVIPTQLAGRCMPGPGVAYGI